MATNDAAQENLDASSSDAQPDPPLGKQVYEQIKRDIRKGTLQPGEMISENQLAEELEISRTPVREALQKLDQEGFVQNRPGQAVTVAKPSMQEVLDVIHVRSILSPELAKLVADSISDGNLNKLTSAMDEMERTVDRDREKWAEADAMFHRTLYDACPNDVLGNLLEQMWSRIHHLTLDSQTSTERVAECTEEHAEILEAIQEGDLERAEKSMREHINRLRESTIRKMSHAIE